MYRLPSRQPVEDVIEASAVRLDGHLLISAAPLDDGTLLATGSLHLRYGLAFLGRSDCAIMPELVALDTGGGFAGEDAWDFLIDQSNLFPRADVFGLREDGVDDMVTVKTLDLMYPCRVFAFSPSTDPALLGQVSALLHSQPDALPERLRQALPVFPSLEAWKATQ